MGDPCTRCCVSHEDCEMRDNVPRRPTHSPSDSPLPHPVTIIPMATATSLGAKHNAHHRQAW